MVARRALLGLSVLLGSSGFSSADPTPRPYDNSGKSFNYRPANGVIPDAETAIRVAIAILGPIYGKDQIAREKPFTATLHDGVWTVKGTFNHPNEKGVVYFGGVAEIDIEKSDGRVKRISHDM